MEPKKPDSQVLDTTQGAYSTLLRGTAIVLFGLIARMGLLFVTEIVAARHLGPSNYGLLTWAITVVAVGSMLSCLGLPTAARRFVPIYLQDRDPARLRGTVLLVTVVTGTVGVLAMTALYANASTLSLRLLGDPAERLLTQIKEGVKAGLHGGMLFEDLGFRTSGRSMATTSVC